jgi:hypothetical protein
MIKRYSDDPDVASAAAQAADIVREVLTALPKAEAFDYGGHVLKLDEYGSCTRCTGPIAEAQQAQQALAQRLEKLDNDTIKEHVQLAVDLLELEARAAQVRAEFHNGHGSEQILNSLLGFLYDRSINDEFSHSHHAEGQS